MQMITMKIDTDKNMVFNKYFPINIPDFIISIATNHEKYWNSFYVNIYNHYDSYVVNFYKIVKTFKKPYVFIAWYIIYPPF